MMIGDLTLQWLVRKLERRPWTLREPGSAAVVYSRSFGGHRAFAGVELRARPSSTFSFTSTATWPTEEKYDAAVLDGVLDVLLSSLPEPLLGVAVALTSVQWHAVDSSPAAFYWAGREAMEKVASFDEFRRPTAFDWPPVVLDQRWVDFTVFMGDTARGEQKSGTVADLYSHFFVADRGHAPSREVLNAKLSSGIDRGHEHGIHFRWEPFTLDEVEYARFCRDLELKASVPAHQTAARSEDETQLRRRYRKALALGDAAEAARVAAIIRARYDTAFT